jgi:tRNA-splicing ligase RtcB
MTKVKVFGPVEQKVMDQLTRCAVEAPYAVLCADNHYGYSQPVGSAIAYRDYICPSGVGYDIACGNKAVRTDLDASLFPHAVLEEIMDEIVKEISFGVGRGNKEVIPDGPVISEIAGHYLPYIKKMGYMAADQLGTVGAGNHYVDLFSDESARLWIGVHFGSRGLGHKIANGFLNLAAGRKWDNNKGESMDAPPTLIKADSELGRDYLGCMEIAGRYAYAGRDWVCQKVAKILGAEIVEEVHNHHNFAWNEEHFGERLWVIRKGCTPAFPGQVSFIGGTMAEVAYIVRGLDSEISQNALYSTVHGAGRVMSRNEAAGRKKWVKDPETGKKRPQRHGGGRINWDETLADMRARGIVLRGAAADEAPGAYKRLDEVLTYHEGTIEILERLHPLGVAMAGSDIEDPFRD